MMTVLIQLDVDAFSNVTTAGSSVAAGYGAAAAGGPYAAAANNYGPTAGGGGQGGILQLQHQQKKKNASNPMMIPAPTSMEQLPVGWLLSMLSRQRDGEELSAEVILNQLIIIEISFGFCFSG